jgi:alanine racemase
MTYTAADIARILSPQTVPADPAAGVAHLLTDSRKLVQADTTLFFALPGPHRDGDAFIARLYKAGVRQFVVTRIPTAAWPGATFYAVADVLHALQLLAAHHRRRFNIPVIGITGSNGKTIVKEWLYQLLNPDHNIARSPKSYNSQVGVPLSTWQLGAEHTLGIFEAGISTVGEMEALAAIIRPTIGVLTAIGAAHDEGFPSTADKQREKEILFAEADIVIGPQALLANSPRPTVTWGEAAASSLRVLDVVVTDVTILHCTWQGRPLQLSLPVTDEASIENGLTCSCVLLYLGYEEAKINARLAGLHPVDMRLQLVHGRGGSTLINDSYSADATSLHLALTFLDQQKTAGPRIAILSDFIGSGKEPAELYASIARSLAQHRVDTVIAIGETIARHLPSHVDESVTIQTYPSTEAFLAELPPAGFPGALLLVKGARRFGFERIVSALETKVHQTVLDINLDALAHNLRQYRSLLAPGTRTMAMVKAFSYGSGSAEIAATLQFHGIDALGVAYADEGIELRRAGIHLPILVMNADEAGFPAVVENSLQPVLYSFAMLRAFETYIQAQGLPAYPVHIELETGMNRLGFEAHETDALTEVLAASRWLRVQSVFTHLAASEDAAQDSFTEEQAARFTTAADRLAAALPTPFLRHIANSAAIIRHPRLQLDMVRLGIGLYGIEISTDRLELQPVATLRSTIAQLKRLPAGETVSYNRRGVVKEESLIATVRIGYADGYSRRLGNGVGKMWVNGQLAPVIGTVCMDMTMLDVTAIPGVAEGDEVVVFGAELSVRQLADWCGTIPYEIMTGVSQRVKRVYFQEG